MIRPFHSRIFHLVEYDQIEWRKRRNNPFVFEVLDPNSNSSIKLDPKFEIPLPNSKSIQGTRVYVDVLSCNGLFYLSGAKYRNISLVCNPITGEFIKLPKNPSILKLCKKICWGFGFHPKTNQYKVMRIHIFEHDHSMVVEMHTVGTSTWINIEVDYPKYLINLYNYCTYLNGALHWTGKDVDENVSIWAFNFDTERFQSFSIAPRDRDTKLTLFEFRGSLIF
ncbi:putative F-box protein At1g53360 [Arachis ipaensis]|nr:putative F-box protein At1g53360 [Arachis ipaensis]